MPALAELGFPGIAASVWFGIVAPAKTPNYALTQFAAKFLQRRGPHAIPPARLSQSISVSRICSPTESRYVDSAMPFLFRCPITGSEVQGFLAQETPSEDPNSFEPVTCLACGQVHLVNFKTGKVLDERSED